MKLNLPSKLTLLLKVLFLAGIWLAIELFWLKPPLGQTATRIPDSLLCRPGSSLDLVVETKNFYASICSNPSGKYIYTGIDKRNNRGITLPAYTEEGTGYVAEKGKYSYILTGASLSITRNNKEIVNEDVIGSCRSSDRSL
jgi:hypothetical protein